MKYILRLIAIILLIQCLMCSYTTSFTTSSCITYENDSNLKWCRYLSTTTSGYGCDASDSSSACGGNLNYRCSSDSAKLPQNSKKLLCPEDSTNCNSQTKYFYLNTDYGTLTSKYFGISTFCWYRFYPYSTSIGNISVKITSLSNANAEVYYESATNVYSFKGTLSSGDSMNVDVDSYSPVWVLVIPSSSNAYISVTGSASSSSSTSSDNTILIAILVPISISCAIVILIIICIIVIKVIRSQKIIKIENNPADDNIEITSSAPVPQSQPRRSVNHAHQLQILNEEVIYPPSRHLTYVINSSRANYRPEMPVKNYEYNPEDPNIHKEVIETGVPIYQSKYN